MESTKSYLDLLIPNLTKPAIFFLLAIQGAWLVASMPSRDRHNKRDIDDDFPKLKLVHVLFRHGDRSPTHTYLTDPYTEADWPQGYGQLSTTGMTQAYDLGDYLRQSYVEEQPDFLDPDYNRNQVYVRSTSFDRTLMTAYSVLAAFFPPTDAQMWNDELPWQPIPVHTVPIEEDRLLVAEGNCPAYTRAQEEYKQTAPVFKETAQKYKELFEYVSQQTGYPATFEGMNNVLDPIYCEYMSNYSLPEWVTEDVLQQIFEMRDVASGIGLSPKFAYLRGGMLLGEMLQHMENVSAGGNTIPQKLFMYSGHDSTVEFFLTTLGVFNHRQPPYTACILVELWEQQPGEHTLLISYRNETDNEPYPLTLSGCEVMCPLERFVELMRPSVPDDLDEACGILSGEENIQKHPSGTTIAVAILTGALLLVVLIGGILCCVKRTKLQENGDYKLVPMESD